MTLSTTASNTAPSPASTAELLDRLHEQSTTETLNRARAQFSGSDDAFLQLAFQYARLAPRLRGQFLAMHGLSTEDAESSQGTPLLLAISAETGRFLRTMALAHRPARILELGSSQGVSTLYLADALRTLGGGTVVATELDPLKCEHLRTHVRTANLERYVDLREGDVFQSVAELDGTFDMVFIDIWASAYLRLFTQIEPLLRPGSIVLTDNMYTADDAVRTYKAYLEESPRYSTTTLDFESGVELTAVLS